MSTHSATMLVQPWGEDQGDHVVINAADFDPAVHKPYPAPEEAPTGLAGMTVVELKALAAEKACDLGEATKKADIVAAMEGAGIEPPAAE